MVGGVSRVEALKRLYVVVYFKNRRTGTGKQITVLTTPGLGSHFHVAIFKSRVRKEHEPFRMSRIESPARWCVVAPAPGLSVDCMHTIVQGALFRSRGSVTAQTRTVPYEQTYYKNCETMPSSNSLWSACRRIGTSFWSRKSSGMQTKVGPKQAEAEKKASKEAATRAQSQAEVEKHASKEAATRAPSRVVQTVLKQEANKREELIADWDEVYVGISLMLGVSGDSMVDRCSCLI
jgi:hypothetical protein